MRRTMRKRMRKRRKSMTTRMSNLPVSESDWILAATCSSFGADQCWCCAEVLLSGRHE